MKSIKITGLIFVLFSFSIKTYSQLWKQYADSAKAYTIQKNVDKAIEFYTSEKSELQNDSANTNTYAQICDSLGALFYLKQQYYDAEKFFIETKQIKEKLSGKENPDYADICNKLSLVYFYMALYDKAGPLCLEAKQIRERVLGKDNIDYIFSCNFLGVLYYYLKQYKKAEPLYLEGIQLQEKLIGKENQEYLASCNRLAMLYSNMEQYEKSEPFFTEARHIQEKLVGKEHLDYATACGNLGTLYWYMRQYEKAELLFTEAKQIQEKLVGREHPSYISSCINLAALYISMRHFERAELLYKDVMKIQEKLAGRDNIEYATSCANLAFVYSGTGQYEKAVPLYLEAIKTKAKLIGKENAVYANDCNNLADNYRYMGQYQNAEQLYLEAKKTYENLEGKENADYANSNNSLGALYDEMGLYEKAEPLYLEAKQIQERVMGKNRIEYALSCNNLGGLYMDMGKYEEARKLFYESENVYSNIEGKENPDYALSCENLAILYRRIGQYEMADSLFLQAKQLYSNTLGKQHPFYAFTCDDLADLYMVTGKYEKSEALFIEAKKIREKVLGKQHPDYGSTCAELANLYWLLKKPFEAAKDFNESSSITAFNLYSVFQFTNEREKTAYIKNKLGEDDIIYSFYLSENIQSAEPYSLSLFHRNLILSSSEAFKRQILSSNDSSLLDKYDYWLGLKKYLAVLYSMPAVNRKEDPVKIEEEAGNLEKDLTRLSASFEKQQQIMDWKDVQKNLKPDEVSLEFASFHYYNGIRFTDSTYYIALVLRKDDSLPKLVKLFEKKQLGALLNNEENLATDQRINSLYTKSSSLYSLIWKPLEKYLKGISRVYFAPAGDLYKISFGAIPINGKQVLSDKYHMVQLNTTANIVDSVQSTINDGDKIQLYGGIQYNADSAALEKAAYAYREANEDSRSLPDDLQRGAGFQYLPGTFQEVEAIKKIAGNTKLVSILTGVNATEESVKALRGKASPEVLHISTHGFFFPDPRVSNKMMKNDHRKFDINGEAFKQSDNPLFRSGLLFAGANNAWKGKPIEGIDDGILTSYEVSNMYLPNTKLVVLSACNTALGEIQGSEGVYGLQRAFKMAGAQYLVMSLWKVLDAETSEFMQLFYKNLFTNQTINDAFYNAQQVMKNKYRSEPYKWAAWVLVR